MNLKHFKCLSFKPEICLVRKGLTPLQGLHVGIQDGRRPSSPEGGVPGSGSGGPVLELGTGKSSSSKKTGKFFYFQFLIINVKKTNIKFSSETRQ